MFLLLLGWIISIATWNKFYIAFIQLIYLDAGIFVRNISTLLIQLCLWISIWRAKCIWRRILIQSMKTNIWLKYSFISNFYYSKMYSSHDNLCDTSFVLLQLKSGSLSPLSKLPWKHGCISSCLWCQRQILVIVSFLAHVSSSTACFAVNNQGPVRFVGRWLYWNSSGGIYQTQGRLDSPS